MLIMANNLYQIWIFLCFSYSQQLIEL